MVHGAGKLICHGAEYSVLAEVGQHVRRRNKQHRHLIHQRHREEESHTPRNTGDRWVDRAVRGIDQKVDA